MTTLQITAILLVLISPAIGSFLGVLADRLGRGEDVVRQPSACRSCHTGLGARDLIPMLSFALSKGRCRHCTAPIPRWLPAIEIAALAAAALAVLVGTQPTEILLNAAFFWVLLTLIATDLMWFRLPDVLTGVLFLLALAISALTGWPSLADAFLGALIGAGSFLAIRLAYQALRRREGLGLGDVKLMAGLGAALGPFHIPLMVLIAALTALAVALAGALAGRVQQPDALSPSRPLPFGAALCAAGAFLWALMRLPVI